MATDWGGTIWNSEFAGVGFRDDIDPTTEIRRYMSFSKFVDLLTFERLYFPSVATLQQSDPLEGRFPELLEFILNGGLTPISGIVSSFGKVWQDAMPTITPHIDKTWEYGSPFGSVEISEKQTTRDVLNMQSNWVDVLCWHTSAVENMAMWKIYGGVEPSICLETSIGKFCQSLKIEDNIDLVIGKVEYEDLRDGIGQKHDGFTPFFLKSRPYAFEHELRVVAFSQEDDYRQKRDEAGRVIPVELRELVTGVVVSPGSPSWFHRLVSELVSQKLSVTARLSDVGVR
jgi:hypothetical protein